MDKKNKNSERKTKTRPFDNYSYIWYLKFEQISTTVRLDGLQTGFLVNFFKTVYKILIFKYSPK